MRRAGIVAGALGLAAAAAVASTRALAARDRRRPDPEADERFGALEGGRALRVTSFDGTRLHVEEFGTGPPLVLLHGFSLDRTTWHYQVRDLAGDHRLVVYDHRGHGRSGLPATGDLSLEALARDLDAVLGATAPAGGAILAGHSMGGMVALAWARAFPEAVGERVRGLVLVDTTSADVFGGMLPGAARRVAAAFQGAQEAAMRALVGRSGTLDALRRSSGALGYLGVRAMGFGPDPSPSKVAFVERLLDATPTEVWTGMMPALAGLDVSTVLGAITVPTLVVVGSHDRLTPPGAAERIAAAIPGAELAVIPGAGHMAMLEKPHAFNARLRAFRARVEREAAPERAAQA